MTSITISLVVIESIIIMLLSYIVDFLLICIIILCYLTLYTDPQLKIAIFWSSKTTVLCGALRVNHTYRPTNNVLQGRYRRCHITETFLSTIYYVWWLYWTHSISQSFHNPRCMHGYVLFILPQTPRPIIVYFHNYKFISDCNKFNFGKTR